jgi:hypothetical protein
MTTTHYKIYYLFLLFMTLGMIAHTVIVGGIHVSYGQQVAQLEKENAQLTEKKLSLSRELSTHLSLAQVSSQAEGLGYAPINNVVYSTVNGIVASR